MTIHFGPGQNIVDLSGVLTFQGARSTGAAAPVTLIYDSFTDIDGTALTAHAPDINTPGNAWTSISGAWSISSNQALNTDAGATARCVINCGVSDCTISVVMSAISGTRSSGIIFRYQDTTHYFYASIMTGSLRIYESPAVVRATTSSTLTSGGSLVVVLSGTSMTASYQGKTVSYSSSNYQSYALHGLYVGASSAPRYDNFTITVP